MVFDIIHTDEADSTNSYLRQIVPPAGRAEGVVVWTDYQTAGRGCGTNTWESERGKNLLFSVLLHPVDVPPEKQFILSMANALAIKAAMDEYVGEVKIKWPNDIYWHNRKLCGTLIETTMRGTKIGDCIIGTGINVNQQCFLSDAPNPVSLSQILQRDVDREEVLRKVLHHLGHYMRKVEQRDWEHIRALYRSGLYRLEEVHRYRFPDGTEEECKLVNVTDDGHLQLQSDGRGGYSKLLSLAFKAVQFVVDYN